VQQLRGDSQELGGRVWVLRDHGRDTEKCEGSDELWIWLGPDREIPENLDNRRVFRTSSVELNRRANQLAAQAATPVHIRAQLSGKMGEAPVLKFITDDGRTAQVTLDCTLQPADKAPPRESIHQKIARLGDTPYRIAALLLDLPDTCLLPISALNRARRALLHQLDNSSNRSYPSDPTYSLESMLTWPDRSASAPPGLYVTCRNLQQAEAAVAAGADGVYLDFLALTGLGEAVRALRQLGVDSVGVALPRIRKPAEHKIEKYVLGLSPDALLLRSVGQLISLTERACHRGRTTEDRTPLLVADFSLNIANTLSALDVLARNCDVFTPCYDLDAAQLCALLDTPLGQFAEVVVHHPMPLFHMEHCIIAAALSTGRDFRDCGRPCDAHHVSLRDRKGVEWPVEADIGCRNSVLHGTAQSAAHRWARLRDAQVCRWRIELLRESAETTKTIVATYRSLINGRCTPNQLRAQLAEAGVQTIEGSLRVMG
jgi:putative protease